MALWRWKGLAMPPCASSPKLRSRNRETGSGLGPRQENARYRQITRRVICDEMSPLIQESREGCLYHAFRDNRAEAERACVRKVTRSSPQVYPVSETKWLYALPKEELFAMQCSGKLKPTEGFRLQLGTGVFTLPSGCKVNTPVSHRRSIHHPSPSKGKSGAEQPMERG